MTVAELRKALEGLPDDMPVTGMDEGNYSLEDTWAGTLWLAATFLEECRDQRLYSYKPHSYEPYGNGCVGPNDKGAKQYFVVC